jgi:hypothetical protein
MFIVCELLLYLISFLSRSAILASLPTLKVDDQIIDSVNTISSELVDSAMTLLFGVAEAVNSDDEDDSSEGEGRNVFI